MARGWTEIPTIYTHNYNTKTKKWDPKPKIKTIPQNKVDNALRNNQRLKYAELLKEGEQAYKEMLEYEDKIIQGYENKKLKSKKLLQEYRIIVKARKKRAEEEKAIKEIVAKEKEEK